MSAAGSDPAYERACLHAVERKLASLRRTLEPGKSLKRVSLRGSYPDTQIVVTYRDNWRSKSTEIAFDLWRPIFEDSRGGREAPEVVAGVIFANVAED